MMLDTEDRMICATCRRAQDDVEFADVQGRSKQVRYKTCRTCRLDRSGTVVAPPGHFRLADGFIPAITCTVHYSKGCVKCYPPRVIRPSVRFFSGTHIRIRWENRWFQIQEVWEAMPAGNHHYWQVAFRMMTWRLPIKFADSTDAIHYVRDTYDGIQAQ